MPTARTDPARRPEQRPAALLAVVLLIVLSALIGAPATGVAAADPGAARLTLTALTPSTVTSSSGATVQVRGRVTNTAAGPLSDLRIRMQRGAALTTAVALRTSLMGGPFPVTTPPRAVPATLQPGATADFDLTLPLSAADGLRIDATGVYPLQLSVTGSVDGAGTTQVAESRTLLPVLSLPADAQRADGFVDPAWGGGDSRLGRDGSLAPDDSSPADFTLIWPLAASPQLAPGVLGGKTEPVRLISDALASSLRPDGRLGTQLTALEQLADDDADSRLREAVCVAVDPDLLATVHGMSLGYLVTTNPADPRAPTTPGVGQQAAADWMATLRRIAPKLCVTALPFAQAGLDSLHTIGADRLTTSALSGAYDVVDAFLGIDAVRGPVLPATGTLTDTGAGLLTAAGVTAAAVASSSLEPTAPVEEGRYTARDLGLAAYDAPISAALGAAGTAPTVPQILPEWQRPDLNGESAVSRRQAALGALAFPMLTVPGTAGQPLPVTGRSAFTVPPAYWSPTADDARALLDTAGLLIAAGTARPVPLAQVAATADRADDEAALITPGDVAPQVAQGYPISAEDAARIREQLTLSDQLQGSLVGSRDTVTTPQAYLTPLAEDALRAIAVPESAAAPTARSLRADRIGAVGGTLDRMRRSVALLDPGGRYTLASERSPLLLIVRNDLALPMRVRMDIDAPAALNVGDVGVQEVPPMGTRQIQIPTHADTSEKATVRIAMHTSTGVPLSDPITLSVYTNAYGKPLFWITVAAGIALVLLTARRLWHRFRGEPDPADENRPEPDEDELRLAATPYEDRLDLAREEHVEAPGPWEGR